MTQKALFESKNGIFQLWILLLFVLTGTIIASVLTLVFSSFSADPELITRSPALLRIIQFISATCMFLLPAIALAWLCSKNPQAYLSVREMPSSKTVILLFFSILAFAPVITLTTLLNEQMSLPAFMEPIENWMREQEAAMEEFVNFLLDEKGISALLGNLIVIALTAAITEEFFFRGALQRIVGKWTQNHHVIIWTVAFTFSAIHLQFYGFIPRVLLGAYFGYLLYWSKNIWIPVLAHFIHNAIAVIAESNEKLKDNEFISGEIQDAHLMGYSVVAVVALIFFILIVKKLREEVSLGTYQEPD